MKECLPFLILPLVLLVSLTGSAQGYYDKTYDFGVVDHPVAVITDSLENVYVCGWYEDKNNENARAFILKTNSSGQEVWRDTLDVPSKYFALCLTHTGDIALAGSRNNRCFLTLHNCQTGAEIWEYEQADSSGYWFATVNEVLDSSIYKLHVVKTKYGPHRIWYYLFDPLNGNYLSDDKDVVNTIYGITYTSILMTADKVWTAGDLNENEGLIVYKNFEPGNSLYIYFDALHIAGVQHYGYDYGCSVHYFYGWGDYYMEVLTIKLDGTDGWGMSFKIVHNNFTVTGSDKYENGKFIITGTIDNELALWFIGHDLTEMEDKTIPTQYTRAGVDVVALPSTDMILMGTERPDTGSNATDVFLMKLDQNGLVSTPEHQQQKTILVYPNPAANQLYIKSSSQSLSHAQAYIVNSMGQTVKTITNLNRLIDLSNLTKGLYVVMVYDKNKLLSQQKFIKK
ncbi:MAG: hypothetical protein DRJ09_05010 [Bacteroidetes bacterium]|nr:MAG: hypothetical protein DRJ09_05010 [Bacteroidota bacterium]